MTTETLEKAKEIQARISELQKEIKRLPEYGYRRRLVSSKKKYFIKFPQRWEGDTDVLMDLTEQDIECLIDIRKLKITKLEEALNILN